MRIKEYQNEIYKNALERFVYSDSLSEEQMKQNEIKMASLVEAHGMPVEYYPIWHPFKFGMKKFGESVKTNDTINDLFGFLDHSLYFVDAILTCPYGFKDNQIENVINLHHHVEDYSFNCEVLKDCKFYSGNAHSILIKVNIPKEKDHTIEKTALTRLFLQQINYDLTQNTYCSEKWADMRTSLLGQPCGALSSPFINQKNGVFIRKLFKMISEDAEVFGEIYGE